METSKQFTVQSQYKKYIAEINISYEFLTEKEKQMMKDNYYAIFAQTFDFLQNIAQIQDMGRQIDILNGLVKELEDYAEK